MEYAPSLSLSSSSFPVCIYIISVPLQANTLTNKYIVKKKKNCIIEWLAFKSAGFSNRLFNIGFVVLCVLPDMSTGGQ